VHSGAFVENMRVDTRLIPARGFDGKLAVHMAGRPQAPVIMLGHSILTSNRMWLGQIALLVQQGYRVVSVDARGHGQSSEPHTQCSMDDLVADNIHVLDVLEIHHAHFMGLSLGGMVGIGLGILHPDRIASLIICSARADAPTTSGLLLDERIAAAREQGTEALAASTSERWFGNQYLDAHPDIARAMTEMIAETSVGGFIACARALQGLDYLTRLGNIAAPVQLIAGARDGVLPDAMRELESRISGAQLEIIPDAGHLPNIDQQRAFNDAIVRRLHWLDL
jgi:3-oxoadipate enol-lactonase